MMNITLDINGHLIQTIGVRRLRPLTKSPRANTICTYEVTDGLGKVLGQITGHAYGAGAVALSIRVLKQYGIGPRRGWVLR